MSDPRDARTSNALFYIDENGRKTDVGLFGDDEPAEPYGYAKGSIDRAVALGWSFENAFLDYGPTGWTMEQYHAETRRRQAEADPNVGK